MEFLKKYKIHDCFRSKEIKHIRSIHFDRDGQINLIVYTDKKIPEHKEIKSTDKIFCNEFQITEVQ
jgi:hypothetical protein